MTVRKSLSCAYSHTHILLSHLTSDLTLTWRKTFPLSKEGRWLLTIKIPASYPIEPPKVEFVTPIVHPNIALATGEICLDLLKTAWTPTYTILEVVRAIRMLLSCPETESPLNVDVAALLRGGDAVGGKALVELWCKGEEGRYDGP